jgi:hypothetical protein
LAAFLMGSFGSQDTGSGVMTSLHFGMFSSSVEPAEDARQRPV